MPYIIEVLSNKESSYENIEKAFDILNDVQTEFRFQLPPERLRNIAFHLIQEKSNSKELLDWIKEYKTKEKGNRQFVILIIDGFLEGNLFGNAIVNEGVAIFTSHSYDRYVEDVIRFYRYYLVRYALGFFSPNARNHEETKGCMFDKKVDKKDIQLSLKTGKICDNCRKAINQNINPEINDAIDKLLKIVSNQYPRALIMKGGGVKGLAFAGAILELEKYFRFDTFVGTSAGAIASVLLGAGYTTSELMGFLENKNFNDFKDTGVLQGITNLFVKQGFYPGNEIEKWLEDLLKSKLNRQVSDITMSNLPNHTLVYASRISNGRILFDSKAIRKEYRASFAARCSMSIPLFFVPKKIEDRKIYDGGLRNNFPLKSFNESYPAKPFIALYLKSAAKSGLILKELLDIVVDGEEREIVDANLDKVVIIDTHPVKTKDFNLSNKKKKFLILAGRVAAMKFLIDNCKDAKVDLTEYQSLTDNLKKIRYEIS